MSRIGDALGFLMDQKAALQARVADLERELAAATCNATETCGRNNYLEDRLQGAEAERDALRAQGERKDVSPPAAGPAVTDAQIANAVDFVCNGPDTVEELVRDWGVEPVGAAPEPAAAAEPPAKDTPASR